MLGEEAIKITTVTESRQEYKALYRELLGLIGRFGYLSKEEVMYGFGLSEQDARNRLNYMVRQELIKPFPSLSDPKTFYCLTKNGLSILRSQALTDETHEFNSACYRPDHQKHDRTLIKIFCALKKMLRSDFRGWVSEQTLRQGESLQLVLEAHKERRVLDGLFQMMVHKEKMVSNSEGKLISRGFADESWWCGLELELSLKSKARYQKQFKALAECVYDRVQEKQKIPLMLFLCGTPTIFDTLIKYQQEEAGNFGRCIFVFGLVDSFLEDRQKTILTRYIGNKLLEIAGLEINQVKVKVSA